MNKNGYKAMFAQVQSVHSAQPNKLEVIMDNKAKRKFTRRPVLVIAAVALAVLLSVSAYAIVTLLSPAQVARESGYTALAAAFEDGKGTRIDETVVSEGYVFTLMGMTSGKNLLNHTVMDAEKTFIVLSVRREDGQPVTVENGMPVSFGVFFEGYKPWQFSSFVLGAGGSVIERDDAFYLVHVIDENIEMLADRTVVFGVWDTALGFAPSAGLLNMAQDGTISFAQGLEKPHAMFTLPLDASKADPARVERVLGELGLTAD